MAPRLSWTTVILEPIRTPNKTDCYCCPSMGRSPSVRSLDVHPTELMGADQPLQNFAIRCRESCRTACFKTHWTITCTQARIPSHSTARIQKEKNNFGDRAIQCTTATAWVLLLLAANLARVISTAGGHLALSWCPAANWCCCVGSAQRGIQACMTSIYEQCIKSMWCPYRIV